MKPIVIIQFSPTEGPGYLADFLNAAGIQWELVRVDAGGLIPSSIVDFGGLAMMGGPMSVNDDLPWIAQVLDLIRSAVKDNVPVIGHCLGGQLLSKALGGEVADNRCMELGWHEVQVLQGPVAESWFGDLRHFITFQWHYQTFSIPQGATRLMTNGYCDNQAFAIGPHIGFQCHIEMKSDMVRAWCGDIPVEDSATSATPSVQTTKEILENVEYRVAALNQVAFGIYRQWLKGVSHA